MYDKLIDKIKEYNTIVIARHVGVDPDALCSQLALRDAILLTYPNKKVLAVGTGSVKFISMGQLDKVENVEDALLIICDTPDQKRVDTVDISAFKYKIKIDHHPFVEKFCDDEIIEDTKTSTCEIIMEIIDATELKCNSSIAETLYIGLASDSNRFLFDSSTADTFALVSKFFRKYPFELSNAYKKLYMRPLSEVRLEGYISSNMIVTDNGLGYIVIKDDIIKQFGVDSASAGNMVNNFNFIREVLVWATITEDVKNKQYRVSIRSRGPEINRIAEKHHGGGHKFASGVKAKTLDDALAVIKELDLELGYYNKSISEG